MGEPNDSALEKLKEKFGECVPKIPEGIQGDEYEDDTLYMCFHKLWEPESDCPGGDGNTLTMLFITTFGEIDNFLDEWVTRTRSESYYGEVINDSSDMCIIPLSLFFNENGDIRENTITFTNTSNSRWSCCSGWNDSGIKVKIIDNDLDIYDYSMEPRGINGDDIDDDVAHTRYSITIDEDKIIDLYNWGLEKLGKAFDYWSP